MARQILKPKPVGTIVLALVLSLATLALIGVESRIPWVLAVAWVLVTPLSMRANLMVHDEFDRAAYLSSRDSRGRYFDVGASAIGNAIGVGSAIGLYVALGLYPESTVLFSRPRTVLGTGVLFDAVVRSVVVLCFGAVGAQLAFFLRAKQFYRRGVISFLGWPFAR